NQKKYYRHSGYPGGLTQVKFQEMMQKFPNRIIEKAVFGMLPNLCLGIKPRTKMSITITISFSSIHRRTPIRDYTSFVPPSVTKLSLPPGVFFAGITTVRYPVTISHHPDY
ncbi:MAG: uL13 family ribosomal protein, partial [Sweet potato little leaf phytoplasma]|nr:uL13 family ribosomal protein [Sweet potato little leaf phytoplasma]